MNYLSSLTQSFLTAKTDITNKLEAYTDKLKQLQLPSQALGHALVVFLIPILALGLFIGVSYLGSAHSHSKGLPLSYDNLQTSSSAIPSINPPKSIIKIDISGAVKEPGVKSLDMDARVNDALLAAGGYSDQADQIFLAQSLNLAQKLNDGDKIFIPNKAQASSIPANNAYPTSPTNPSPVTPLVSSKTTNSTISPSIKPITESKTASPTNLAATPAGPISINTASQSQLESLPGIGPVYAKAIIDGRPYASTNDLCTKKVVKNSTTCQKIQSLITL